MKAAEPSGAWQNSLEVQLAQSQTSADASAGSGPGEQSGSKTRTRVAQPKPSPRGRDWSKATVPHGTEPQQNCPETGGMA